MKEIKIGAHKSAAGGVWTAVERVKEIGGNCLQIFGASPRQWHVKPVSKEDATKFKAAMKEHGIYPVYLHAAYLPNLASSNVEVRKKSVKNLSEHLHIAEDVGASGLIFHIGSGKELPKEKAIDLVVAECKQILKNVSGKTELVMENSAGGGQKLGSDVADIGTMIKKINSKRMKVCIDTAHAFEAGEIEDYSSNNIKKFFDKCDDSFGLDKLVVIHANDSKTPYNSHHDRHENIGQGHIGMEGFKNLAKDKRLRGKVWILETPGFDGLGPDVKNMKLLKSCFK